MVYSFARIGAALAMKVEDVYVQNHRLWVRLHEKGGKRHEMPCHHNLESYLHAYIDGCGVVTDPKGPLFRTIGAAQLRSRRRLFLKQRLRHDRPQRPLNSEVAKLKFDPADPASVEFAVHMMERIIDQKAGRYSSNPIGRPFITKSKEASRRRSEPKPFARRFARP